MWLILLLMLTSVVPQAHADDISGLELREVYLDFRNYFPGGTEPIIQSSVLPDRHLDKKLDLHLNMDLLKVLYWDNMINSSTDKDSNGSGQFRVVGWEMAFGIRLMNSLHVGYYHHSQHLLDTYSTQHFPVEDAIQIKLYIFSKDQHNSLIN